MRRVSRRRLRPAPPTRHHRGLTAVRRTILSLLAALVAVFALGSVVVATSDTGSTVTRPRLERSLTNTFANLYVDQAHIKGRDTQPPRCTPRPCATRPAPRTQTSALVATGCAW
ncbi:hypothetical protein GCM10009843_01510 [Nocardioides bigeumensis]|uniref:Uncharacterized protein n=1 Tax=Nocardioides bigeumensis TaxID=433657 RepID=A0ABN2XJW1_9ACTN